MSDDEHAPVEIPEPEPLPKSYLGGLASLSTPKTLNNQVANLSSGGTL